MSGEQGVSGSFAPSVMIGGEAVTPKGYHWILAFALAGCEWAIKKADDPNFREMIRADLKEESDLKIHKLIADYEARISDLKDQL